MAMETEGGIDASTSQGAGTDVNAGAGGGGQFGGGSNDSKNAGDRSTQAGVVDSNGGAFGLGGSAPTGSSKGVVEGTEDIQSIEKEGTATSSVGAKGPVDTGIGFIDRKANSAIEDPIGTLIGIGLGLTPFGMAMSVGNLAATAGRGSLGKEVNAGGVLSAAIQGLLSGDITAAPASQLAANDANLGRSGESNTQISQNQSLESAPQIVNPSPSVVGTVVSQPSVPLSQAQPGVRTSNPFAPSAPLQQGIGSIWL